MLINTPSRYYNAMTYLQDSVDSHSPDNLLEMTVDVETTGLKMWHGDRVCGIAIECKGKSFYFPFRHGVGMGEINIPVEHIQDFVELLSCDWVVYLGHNYKFDLQMLYVDGIPIPKLVEDTQLAAHLMNENEYDYKNGKPVFISGKVKTMYRLKELSDRYLGGTSSTEEAELERKIINVWRYANTAKEAKGKMWMLAPEHVAPYAEQDVMITRGLRNFYVPHLQQWDLYDMWQENNEVAIAATWMEIYGVSLNVDLTKQYMEESVPKAQQYLAKIQEIAGYPLNPRSNPQMSNFLGMPSTAKEKLEVIRDSEDFLPSNPDYTIGETVKTVEAYRAYEKVNVNYYEKFLKLADDKNVIHTNIHLTGTVTGRWSMSDPPMQAVPKYSDVYKVKDVIVARPGYVLVEADQSQAEIRLANHYTKDPVMRDKILRDADSHSETAEALDIPRDAAKRMNFSCIYGIGAAGLSKRLHIEESVASDYLNKYHKLYKGFRALSRRTEAVAEHRGYIRLWTGRVRRYDRYNPAHKAMSNLVQGAVAEIIRLCILRAWRELTPVGVRLLLQVHDSILFEVPEDILYAVLPTINSIMTDFEFDVPLKVDIKYGKSWGAMTKWEAPSAICTPAV